MRKLYKFHWDCGRHGHLHGTFVADDADVEQCIGKGVSFGEVLGKHSRIAGTLDREDLVVLTDDVAFIDRAIEYGLIPSGHNPIPRILHPEDFE